MSRVCPVTGKKPMYGKILAVVGMSIFRTPLSLLMARRSRGVFLPPAYVLFARTQKLSRLLPKLLLRKPKKPSSFLSQ